MNKSDSTATLDKSLLWSAYNFARHSGRLDAGRLNRALGYIQAGRAVLLPNGTAIVSGTDTYYVTREGCDCPDHRWRGSDCKHQLARFILMKMRVLEQEAPAPQPGPEEERSVGEYIVELWGA